MTHAAPADSRLSQHAAGQPGAALGKQTAGPAPSYSRAPPHGVSAVLSLRCLTDAGVDGHCLIDFGHLQDAVYSVA